MNRQELIAAIVEKTGVTKADADKVLKGFVEAVTESVAAGGTFERVERGEREGRNPQTGKTIKIAACKAPKFTAGAAFKDAVNR